MYFVTKRFGEQWSADIKREVSKRFHITDNDLDRCLTKKEFMKVLKTFNTRLSDTEADQLMGKYYKKNNNGENRISYGGM